MDYELFVKKVREVVGIDLASYKRPQMERRITSLMRAQGFHSFREYLDVLKRDPAQKEKFINHLTINVSEFYRNPAQWDVLAKKILPEILKRNPQPKTWSAGCATGEESYTLAMLLREKIRGYFPRVLATDIDEKALEKAKAGIYQKRAVENLPPYLLRKYFVKVGEQYQVIDELKELVNFKKHDLLKDPFDTNFDLILCRNVVIYFTNEAKDFLYRRFSEALRPGGILFTGSTEQIFSASQLGLKPVSPFFYQKKD
ncbi:MAG: CheR family methyltransferase [Thermacetogeniaceae bacterium]